MRYLLLCLLLGATSLAHTRLVAQVQQHNLGRAINSAFGEIAPVITPDGNTLYFVRDKHPTNACNQAVWTSTRQADGTWSQATKLPAPFNQLDNNGINSVSADGNTLLVPNRYHQGEFIGKGFSLARKEAQGWGAFRALHMPRYAELNQGNVAFAQLSTDGNKITMCFSPTGNDANSELYISFRQNDTLWSEPQPMQGLNTEHNEITPFLAADNRTLYFASNRPGGLGKFDIYRTVPLDSTFTRWAEPQNMGPDFNSPDSEAYFSIDARGEQAYLASTRNAVGAQDIVSIRLQQEARPDPVALLRGAVLDERGKPVEALVRYQNLATGLVVGQATSNPQDGSYQIALPVGHKYRFSIVAGDFFTVSDTVDLVSTDSYQELKRDISLPRIEVDVPIRLDNIFFANASADLLPESRAALDALAETLHDRPQLHIEIAGHTDAQGGDAYNRNLSAQRAQSVLLYLLQKQVATTRLSSIGYGPDRPVQTNDTPEGRAANRRVEFRVLQK